MPEHESHKPDFDWRVTTFEGSRREQLRRWAQLPLGNILLAIEEMQDLAYLFGTASRGEYGESARGSSVKEPPAPYRGKRSWIKSKQRS
ncbi:MAG: hypothetical protein HY695_11890 [Deltaproteobacteria bacterium]|nr:hypothetical protein [Deltaproteobacteria bacterium]